MRESYATEQEQLWAGEFGTDYIKRNRGERALASNLALLSRALRSAQEVSSCIEFGANIGLNLRAMQLLLPGIEAHAIEINHEATRELAHVIPQSRIHHTSILDFEPQQTWDLVLTKGVLIHMNPACLPQVYDKLVAACRRYLLVAEYYNPSPVTVSYRGHEGQLFKRDFAGEIMERHEKVRLLDYGFAYRRDPKFPQDDITWFLMEVS